MVIVVKIGSQSLLQKTDEHGVQKINDAARLDQTFMAELVAQVAQLKQQGHVVYLISSGAVAAGRGIWPIPPHSGETAQRQILAGLGQVELMQVYKKLAAVHGLHTVQLLLTKSDFISRSHYLNLERLLLSLQDYPELLPVINENDSISVDELMFTDNDQLAGVLAQQLRADLLLLLTETPGVFDRDPREARAQMISLLGSGFGSWSKRPKWPKLEGRSQSGRGGISSKLETARKTSRAGVVTAISAARQAQVILQITQQVEHLHTLLQAVPDDVQLTGDIQVEQTESGDKLLGLNERLRQWCDEWRLSPQLGSLALPPSRQLAAARNSKAGSSSSSSGQARGVRKWLSARNLAAGQARIIVNDGLAQKMQGKKQVISILPVGIVAYTGAFARGDLIDIYSTDKEKLGIGLARYSHTQLSKTMGQKNQPIFIHYNYLHVEKWAQESF